MIKPLIGITGSTPPVLESAVSTGVTEAPGAAGAAL
jgi:hypothetical protein